MRFINQYAGCITEDEVGRKGRASFGKAVPRSNGGEELDHVDARLCLAALPATYCLPGNVEALGKLLLGKPAFMAQAG